MSDDLSRAIGEANGKLDTLLQLVRDHIKADETRFTEIDAELKTHAADINKAKGARTAIMAAATFVAGLVSIAVTVAFGK